MNCDGRILVRAERCGDATAVADIVRAVEAAQARTAPLQGLADEVAGKFAVGVLSISAATFLFWAAAAPRIFPQVCYFTHVNFKCICDLICDLLYKADSCLPHKDCTVVKSFACRRRSSQGMPVWRPVHRVHCSLQHSWHAMCWLWPALALWDWLLQLPCLLAHHRALAGVQLSY